MKCLLVRSELGQTEAFAVCVCVCTGTAEQVQICFERLSSRPAGVERIGPSSFRFCWGDEDGADGPGLHHLTLDGVLTLKHGVLTPSHSTYWHPALQQCNYW